MLLVTLILLSPPVIHFVSSPICSAPCLLLAPLTMQSSCCFCSPPPGYQPSIKLCFLGTPAGSISHCHQGPFPFTPPGSGISGEAGRRRKCTGSSFVLPLGLCSIPRSLSSTWAAVTAAVNEHRGSNVVHPHLSHCCQCR